MILSKRSSWMAGLLALLLFTSFLATTAYAQEDPEPSPGDGEEPSPSPSPLPSPPTTTDAGLPVSPTPTAPVPTSTPTSTMPDPIFSTSNSCTACKPQWPILKTCQSYLPPNSVNLTVITSVLPFYSCMCKDNMSPIDGMLSCSSCLENTGQLAFLHPMFYKMSQTDVRAFKQVCTDTKDGTSVPPDSAAAGLLIKQNGVWVMAIVTAAAVIGVFIL